MCRHRVWHFNINDVVKMCRHRVWHFNINDVVKMCRHRAWSSMSTLRLKPFSVNQERDFCVDLLNFDLNNSTRFFLQLWSPNVLSAHKSIYDLIQQFYLYFSRNFLSHSPKEFSLLQKLYSNVSLGFNGNYTKNILVSKG